MRVRVYVGITRRGGRVLPAVPGAVRIVQGLRVLRRCSCGSPARGAVQLCADRRRDPVATGGRITGGGAIPYYEGGVGVGCFLRILEKAGYKVIVRDVPDSGSDYYYIEKAKDQAAV